jgi:hypothetical protein
VRIIDIDLDRRRISLSRKQAVAAAAARPERPGGSDIELERDEETEVEARESSEAIGMPPEDALQRPQTVEEVGSAAESAPEITEEPLAPEAAGSAEAASNAAPFEEREDAEIISAMAPESPPEGHEGLTAAEGDKPRMEVRINQEEREPGAVPGETVDEVADELAPIPEAEGEPVASEQESEFLQPDEKRQEESIESIVEDLKRKRGRST